MSTTSEKLQAIAGRYTLNIEELIASHKSRVREEMLRVDPHMTVTEFAMIWDSMAPRVPDPYDAPAEDDDKIDAMVAGIRANQARSQANAADAEIRVFIDDLLATDPSRVLTDQNILGCLHLIWNRARSYGDTCTNWTEDGLPVALDLMQYMKARLAAITGPIGASPVVAELKLHADGTFTRVTHDLPGQLGDDAP